LFVDAVDSTRIAAELGDAHWGKLIERLYDRARIAVEDTGGRVIKTTGDGLLAVFSDPRPAILVGRSIAKAARSLNLVTRAGIHITAMSNVEEFDIAGIGVNVAARVMALAPGGGIATTAAVRESLRGDRFRFASLGNHELKGVPGQWELFEVTALATRVVEPPRDD
jgi:class 3 adenylate cyclase